MKKYLYVVFRTSFIGSLVMLAFASSTQAQDPDQITAADVAGYRLSFSLQGLAPLGKDPDTAGDASGYSRHRLGPQLQRGLHDSGLRSKRQTSEQLAV